MRVRGGIKGRQSKKEECQKGGITGRGSKRECQRGGMRERESKRECQRGGMRGRESTRECQRGESVRESVMRHLASKIKDFDGAYVQIICAFVMHM